MEENAAGPLGGPAPAPAAVPAGAPAGPDEPGGTPGPPRRRPWRRDVPVLVGVALVLSFLLKTFVVQPFYIPSESMENTLRIGDRVLVDKIDPGSLKRGDVVVFNGVDSFAPEVRNAPSHGLVGGTLRAVARWFGVAPPGERDFVKRVVGMPGDH